MRVLAMLAVSVAALPLVALADPAPSEAPAPAATQTAPAPTMTAQATGAAAAPVAATASAGANLDEVECRSTPPATGTRLGGGRECHTVREWNERTRQDQRLLEQHQSVSYRGRGGGG